MLLKSVRTTKNMFRVRGRLFFWAWLVWALAPLSEKVSFHVFFHRFLVKCVFRVYGRPLLLSKGHGHRHGPKHSHRPQVPPQATQPEPQPSARPPPTATSTSVAFRKVSVSYRRERIFTNKVQFCMRGVEFENHRMSMKSVRTKTNTFRVRGRLYFFKKLVWLVWARAPLLQKG